MKTTKHDNDYANDIIIKYEKAIRKRIYKKLPPQDSIPQEDREDLFDEVILTFIEAIHDDKVESKYGEPSTLAYIYKIVDSAGSMFYRRRKRDKKYLDYEPLNYPTFNKKEEEERDPWLETLTYYDEQLDFSPAEAYEAKELEGLVISTSRQPEILKLRIEEHSIKETAKILNLPYETVRKRIQREKKRLATMCKGGL